MKWIIIALAMLSTPAAATCIGSGSIRTCTDTAGNTYTTTQLGNTSITQGSSSQTGTTWNQTSTRLGNGAVINGMDSQGRSWNGYANRYGVHGTDSNGNPF